MWLLAFSPLHMPCIRKGSVFPCKSCWRCWWSVYARRILARWLQCIPGASYRRSLGLGLFCVNRGGDGRIHPSRLCRVAISDGVIDVASFDLVYLLVKIVPFGNTIAPYSPYLFCYLLGCLCFHRLSVVPWGGLIIG